MRQSPAPPPVRPATIRPLAVADVETWIFDLDNTLYPARCNLFAAIDRRMGEFIADTLGLELAEAKVRQKQFFHDYGTTLRGLMIEHRINPQDFLSYVHNIDLDVIEPAPRLDKALAALTGRKLIFTNGTVAHAGRVLARLGIARHFEAVYDIVAANFLPKPDPAPYLDLCTRYDVAPATAVMVEDMARNLLPAHALGMTTVWLPHDSDWSSAGNGEHINHQVDDLTAWLEAAITAAAAPARPITTLTGAQAPPQSTGV